MPPDGDSWGPYTVAAAIGAIITAIGTLLTLYWSKGTKSRIDIMNAEARLMEARVKASASDVEQLKKSYEARMTAQQAEFRLEIQQAEAECEKQLGKLQAHVDIVDKKLDTCEEKHTQAMAEAAELRGLIKGIQAQQQNLSLEMAQVVRKG